MNWDLLRHPWNWFVLAFWLILALALLGAFRNPKGA